MIPPEVTPWKTFGLKKHVPNDDQKRIKLKDAFGRKGKLIYRQRQFWSPLEEFPPIETSTYGFT